MPKNDEKRTHSTTPAGKDRFCPNCGEYMGFILDKFYDRNDTCGAQACEREARYQAEAEREEAHEQLDRDLGD